MSYLSRGNFNYGLGVKGCKAWKPSRGRGEKGRQNVARLGEKGRGKSPHRDAGV